MRLLICPKNHIDILVVRFLDDLRRPKRMVYRDDRMLSSPSAPSQEAQPPGPGAQLRETAVSHRIDSARPESGGQAGAVAGGITLRQD